MIDPRSPEVARALIEAGGPVWFPVRGDSMVPTLREGDRVRVVSPGGLPRLGEVFLFRQEDYLVLHRCLGPARGAGSAGPYRARGDGRLRLDPPVPLENVLGRAVEVEGRGGVLSLEGGAARLYAGALAIHSLAWSWLGAKVGGSGAVPERWVRRVDSVVVRVVHALAFRLAHRRRPPEPPEPAC